MLVLFTSMTRLILIWLTFVVICSSFSGLLELIESLHKSGVIVDSRVKDTMLAVDRAFFVSKFPYVDHPQQIGCGQTISAPHMHAYVLQVVADKFVWDGKKHVNVLDIGSGSGIMSAYFAKYFGRNCRVYGIDNKDDLVNLAYNNIAKFDHTLLSSGTIMLKVGDGKLGYPAGKPYDVIHIGACCEYLPTIMAQEQLKPGGILIAPVKTTYGQKMVIIQKDEHNVVSEPKYDIGVTFVPLT